MHGYRTLKAGNARFFNFNEPIHFICSYNSPYFHSFEAKSLNRWVTWRDRRICTVLQQDCTQILTFLIQASTPNGVRRPPSIDSGDRTGASRIMQNVEFPTIP
jgi:hypothetical protein